MAIYSGFSPQKMVIFHSYVSLPEGIFYMFGQPNKRWFCIPYTPYTNRHFTITLIMVEHGWTWLNMVSPKLTAVLFLKVWIMVNTLW